MDSCTRFGTFYTAQQLLPSTGELSIECHEISDKRFVMQVVSRKNCTMHRDPGDRYYGSEIGGCFGGYGGYGGYGGNNNGNMMGSGMGSAGMNPGYGGNNMGSADNNGGYNGGEQANGGYNGGDTGGGSGYGSGYGGGVYGGGGYGGGGMGHAENGGGDLMLGSWDGMERAAQHGMQALADNVNRRLDAAAQLLDVVSVAAPALCTRLAVDTCARSPLRWT